MKILRTTGLLMALALALLAAAYSTGVSKGLAGKINHGAVHDVWAMGIAISDGFYGLHKGYIGQPEVLDVLREVILPDGLLATTEGNLKAAQDPKIIEAGMQMATMLDKKEFTPYNEPYARPFFVNWGEDSGQADWYQLSFFLYGYHATAMYNLYFTLFTASMLVFFFQHRRNFWAIASLTALTGTFWTLFYLDTFAIFSVPSVNSNRFMGTMVVIPTLHILLLLQQKRKLSRLELVGLLLQATLISFMVSMRKSAQWAILLVWAWVIADLAIYCLRQKVWQGKWQAMRAHYRPWVHALAVFFLFTSGYNFVRLQMHNDIYFTDCMQPYRFTWHSAFLGFNTHPNWQKVAPDYLKGLNGDGIGWTAAEHRYRQTTPCWEYICQNTGFYPSGLHDTLMRKEFLSFARHHPGFMAELYFWYKPKKLLGHVTHSLSLIPLLAYLALPFAALSGFFAGRRFDNSARQWKSTMLPLAAIGVMTTAPHMFAYPIYVQDTTWLVMAVLTMASAGIGLWFGQKAKRHV